MQKRSLLLTSALLALGSVQLCADEVKLTTGLAVGEKLTLALNADLAVSLNWDNGSVDSFVSDGSLQTIDVKDAGLTITTTQGKLTSLYVQGNQLTALELTDAPHLRELYAADNRLESVAVNSVPTLQTIDLQNNQLVAFNTNQLTELKSLNVAGNNIDGTSLKINSSARPQQLIVADNGISSLPTASVLSKVQTLWAQHNALTTASLTQSKDLRSLCLSGNQIKTLTLAEAPLLADVWVENNQLKTLDLSKGSPALVSLAADHNLLTEVLWDAQCRTTCSYAYLNNNALFINSMPPGVMAGRTIHINCEPMEPYAMETQYELSTLYDWSTLIAKNGWGLNSSATYTLTDRDDYTLVKGTDFTESSKKFKFTTAHAGVVLTASTKYYTFSTTPFNVGVIEGIETVNSGADSATFLTARGTLSLQAEGETAVKVYNAAGVCVVNSRVAAGKHSWQLPSGIYVANGTKVLVP